MNKHLDKHLNKHYRNPIKKQGDFADPFVLRHNGRYYLYCTNPDIRCWCSDDLVEWTPCGAVIADETFGDYVPFAPEVTYSNGHFYMYTSPSGHGHYVLRSSSPTGPFEKISENVAHAIDGSILIDDDGSWYFYWAGDEGIWCCKMLSPTEFGEPVLTGAFLHGWTEGPYLIKRDGLYYMTYTGNHYLSNGYRIHVAVSDNPMTGFKDTVNNPLIIHTEGSGVGLGHSCTVIGPDLISRYMVYHNLNGDQTRDLNIDRQVWNGTEVKVWGPTRHAQTAPAMPDFCDNLVLSAPGNHWTAGNAYPITVVSKQCAEAVFTAEFNLLPTAKDTLGSYGVLFGWQHDRTHYAVEFAPASNQVRLIAMVSGIRAVLNESALPEDFNHLALHCIRVISEQDRLLLTVDSRTQFELRDKMLSLAGSIGYFADGAKAETGYTAFTNGSERRLLGAAAKPVPGSFSAVFATDGNPSVIEENRAVLVKFNAGEELCYHLNSDQAADYCMELRGRFAAGERLSLEITVDSGYASRAVLVPDSPELIRLKLPLPKGDTKLSISLLEGSALLSSLCFYPEVEVDSLTIGNQNLDDAAYGKKLWGDAYWANYNIQAVFSCDPLSVDGNSGILLRVTNPAEGGEGKDPVLGINFFCGYQVGVDKDGLFITKHLYDRKIVARAPYADMQEVKLNITLSADQICVFRQGEQSPCMTYRDPCPLTYGKVGIHTEDAKIEVTELTILEEYR